MFCQCVFNSEGKIIDRSGTVEGVDLQSDNITDLFREVGIDAKEWNVGKEYIAKYGERKFRCVATKLGDNFQFVGIDMSKEEELKEQLESQQRISDLNLNRLLKTFDKLRERNQQIEQEIVIKNTQITEISHKIRTSLTDIIGVVEILEESKEVDYKQLFQLIKESSLSLFEYTNDIENN